MADIEVPSSGEPLPSWAYLQRQLIDALGQAIGPYLERYVRADGSLTWGDELAGRDALDDGYEAFWNWPLAYAIGGPAALLEHAERGWEGVTRQFREYGQVLGEYERGYDWFHQGEGNLLLYGILDAGGNRGTWVPRVRTFAELFVDPRHGNLDAGTGFFRSPHVGAGGARFGPYRFSAPFTDDRAYYEWSERHITYGLPLLDVPGIAAFDDLRDPANAQRMGEAMNDRMLRGDVAVSLTSTGLAAEAYLATADSRYREWLLGYVDRWRELAAANLGVVPDNVGPSGSVGELHGGRWYGGHYGWQWPHGLEPIASALFVAGSAAWLLTGSGERLDMLRSTLDAVLEHREAGPDGVLVPQRHGPDGWFDFARFPLRIASSLWLLEHDPADLARLELVLGGEPAGPVRPGPGRFGDANTLGWIRYLRGENPAYPDDVLRESLAEVAWRLAQIRNDDSDLSSVHPHHWQWHNPVVIEALIELACGGPVPMYNGGLTLTRLAYRDPANDRPGLPADVAALVTSLDRDSVTVELVNVSPAHHRVVELRGGFHDEHVLGETTIERADGAAYPGGPRYDSRPAPQAIATTLDTVGRPLRVALAPGAHTRMRIRTTRRPT